MDQVAAAGIKLLAAYKKQLDAAKEKVEIARRLANKIEIFEVTITMIPRRGSSEHFKAEIREETKNEDTKHDGTKNEGADEKAVTKITQVKNYVKEAVNYGVENAKTMVIDKAQDILKQTPFGKKMRLRSFVKWVILIYLFFDNSFGCRFNCWI